MLAPRRAVFFWFWLGVFGFQVIWLLGLWVFGFVLLIFEFFGFGVCLFCFRCLGFQVLKVFVFLW